MTSEQTFTLSHHSIPQQKDVSSMKGNDQSKRVQEQIFKYMDDYGKWSNQECKCKPWALDDVCER